MRLSSLRTFLERWGSLLIFIPPIVYLLSRNLKTVLEQPEKPVQPDVPFTALRASSNETMLLIHWVFKPAEFERKNPKKISGYYQTIMDDISRNDRVYVCQNTSSLAHCYSEYDTMARLVVAFPHIISSEKLEDLGRIMELTARQVRDVKTEFPRRRVYIAYFINKIYNDMPTKMAAFMDAFFNSTSEKRFFDGAVVFTWSPHAPDFEKKYGVPFQFIPFGVDFRRYDLTKYAAPWDKRECDLFVRWDPNPLKYRFREEIDMYIANGSASDLKVNAPTGIIRKEKHYITAMSKCKMHVSTIGMPGEWDLVGTRYTEVMASGTSLLFVERETNASKVAYSVLGIVEDENVVMFSSVTEFFDKVRYYRNHSAAAAPIVKRSYEWAKKNTWQARSDTIVETLLDLVSARGSACRQGDPKDVTDQCYFHGIPV